MNKPSPCFDAPRSIEILETIFADNNMALSAEAKQRLAEGAAASGMTDAEGDPLIHIDSLLAAVHQEWRDAVA